MSGNINDTDIIKIKNQVADLLGELYTLENTPMTNAYLRDKYSYLINTSKSLYNYIINGYNTPRFDEKTFYKNLDIMLNSIENIQKQNISQHDASINVGTVLAEKYIPNFKEISKK